MPFKLSKDYKFAFIVHSRSIDDVARKFPFAKKIPNKLIEWWCRNCWPIIVSRINGLRSERKQKKITGYVIGVPMTAHQMIEDRELAVHRIIQACELAEKMGVKIVGLGALTASVSGGGLFFADRVKIGITTGHALTCVNVVSTTLAIIEEVGYKLGGVSMAVVGAAGSIGSVCALLLAQKGVKKLLLVDLRRKNKKLDNLVNSLLEVNANIEIEVTNKINKIRNYPIVITATNAPEALVKSEDLAPGAIVIDDAQPSDIDPDLIIQRKDVMIVDGGVIKTPEIYSNFNFGLADLDDNFACLAEVMCLAVIHWRGNYNIGRTDLNKIKEVGEIAKFLDFHRADFQHQGIKYLKKDIEKIKAIISKNV